MFYAKYDYTATPKNPGYGFGNSKKVLAFKTLYDLKDFLDMRNDFDYRAKKSLVKKR